MTLIEMLVVLVILAIAAVLAAPNASRWIESYTVRKASRQLVSDLQLAKLKTISQGVQHRILFDPANKTYKIQETCRGRTWTARSTLLALFVGCEQSLLCQRRGSGEQLHQQYGDFFHDRYCLATRYRDPHNHKLQPASHGDTHREDQRWITRIPLQAHTFRVSTTGGCAASFQDAPLSRSSTYLSVRPGTRLRVGLLAAASVFT